MLTLWHSTFDNLLQSPCNTEGNIPTEELSLLINVIFLSSPTELRRELLQRTVLSQDKFKAELMTYTPKKWKEVGRSTF